MYSHTLNKDAFKNGDTRQARAETFLVLYSLKPEKVKQLVLLQGLDLEDDIEVKQFIDMYLLDQIKFDMYKFLLQIELTREEQMNVIHKIIRD